MGTTCLHDTLPHTDASHGTRLVISSRTHLRNAVPLGRVDCGCVLRVKRSVTCCGKEDRSSVIWRLVMGGSRLGEEEALGWRAPLSNLKLPERYGLCDIIRYFVLY